MFSVWVVHVGVGAVGRMLQAHRRPPPGQSRAHTRPRCRTRAAVSPRLKRLHPEPAPTSSTPCPSGAGHEATPVLECCRARQALCFGKRRRVRLPLLSIKRKRGRHVMNLWRARGLHSLVCLRAVGRPRPWRPALARSCQPADSCSGNPWQQQQVHAVAVGTLRRGCAGRYAGQSSSAGARTPARGLRAR